MVFMPLFSIIAAVMFLLAVRTYEEDVKHVRELIAAQSITQSGLPPLGEGNFAQAVAGH
jgi:hypothetical protein